MEILQQTNLIPQSIPANGLVTGNAVQNPNNLLDTTDNTALFGATSDVTVGNYPFSIPTGAVIVGIAGVMKALINNSSMPAGSVTPALVTYDDEGNPTYFPNTPIDGMSGVLQEYDFGQEYDLWGNDSWTAEQINNIQLNLLGNNSIQVAWATLTVFYYIPVVTPTPPPFTPPGCDNCDSDIQALPFKLARVFQSTDTAFLLESFNDAGGNPITLDMIGDCGGTIEMTLDPDLPRGVAGANFVENVTIDSSVATISITTQGVLIELSSLNYRGKGFSEPYGHDPDNISEHGVDAVAIITNNGPWSSKLVKKCGEDVIFSAPINVSQNGTEVVGAIHDLNFIGDNIQAEQNGSNPRQADVTVISNPTNSSATVENTATGTTNTTQATTLTVPLTVVDANYLRVAVITENQTITSVDYNGIAMTLIGQEVNAGANLKTALYGLINPAVGANNVVVTMAVASVITAIATGWLDVDVSNPVDGVSSGNSGSSTAPTDTATTTTQNTVMQDVVGTTSNPTTFTQFGLWAIQGDVTTGNRPGASSSRRVLVPGTVTDTYGISVATPWAIVMAGIRGISNPDNNVESVTGTYIDDTDPLNPVSVVPLNHTAASAPTISNDNTQGYAIDSKWYDTSNATLYTCTSAATGAAVWVAIAGGSGAGVTSINGNGNAAQLIAAGAGISIDSTTTPGTTTITNTGSSGGYSAITPGSELKLTSFNSNALTTTAYQMVQFGSYLIAKNSANGDSQVHWFQADANTGSLTEISQPIATRSGLFVSEDGLNLYTIDYSFSASVATTVLRKYDQSLTLLNTYTGTSAATGSSAVASSIAFLVDGTTLLAQIDFHGAGSACFWHQFTLSGTSLTSPTITNLQFWDGFSTYSASQYAVVKSGSYYLQATGNGTGSFLPQPVVKKYSYSSATFTQTGSTNQPIGNIVTEFNNGSSPHGGFTIPTTGRVGWYRNTSSTDISSGTTYATQATVYSIYTF